MVRWNKFGLSIPHCWPANQQTWISHSGAFGLKNEDHMQSWGVIFSGDLLISKNTNFLSTSQLIPPSSSSGCITVLLVIKLFTDWFSNPKTPTLTRKYFQQIRLQNILSSVLVAAWSRIKHEPCKRSWCYTIEPCMQPTATSTLVQILLLCKLTVTVLYSLYSISDVSS